METHKYAIIVPGFFFIILICMFPICVTGKPSASDMSKLLELQEALRRNMQLFYKDLDMNDIEFLDKLYEKECLTETEYEDIRSRKRNTDKSRLLFVKIKDSDPIIIESFLEILELTKAYNHLSIKVKETLQKIRAEDKNVIKCVICVIRECVDIHDVVDHLYKEEIISGCLYTDIAEEENLHGLRHYIWEKIFSALEEDKTNGIKILKESLGVKYRHISTMLETIPSKDSLKCRCTKRRSLRTRPPEDAYASSTDVSTTSTLPRNENDSALDTADYGTDTDVQDDDNVFEHTDYVVPIDVNALDIQNYQSNAQTVSKEAQEHKKESEVTKHFIDFVESHSNRSAVINRQNTPSPVSSSNKSDVAARRRSLPEIKPNMNRRHLGKQQTQGTSNNLTTVNKTNTDTFKQENQASQPAMVHMSKIPVKNMKNKAEEGTHKINPEDCAQIHQIEDSNVDKLKKIKSSLKYQVTKLQKVSRTRSLPPTEKKVLISNSYLTNGKSRRDSRIGSSSVSNPDLSTIDKSTADISSDNAENKSKGKLEVEDTNDFNTKKKSFCTEDELQEMDRSDDTVPKTASHVQTDTDVEKPQTISRLPRPRTNSLNRNIPRRRRSRPSPKGREIESRAARNSPMFDGNTNTNTVTPVLQFSTVFATNEHSSIPSSATKTKVDDAVPHGKSSPTPSTSALERQHQSSLTQSSSSESGAFGKHQLSNPDRVFSEFKSRLQASKTELRVSQLRKSDDTQTNGLRRSGSLPLTENLTNNREGRKRRHELVSTKTRSNSSERRQSLGGLRPVASTSDLNGFSLEL